MSDKPHILVVCGRNKRRSRTAEYIFKNDDRFHIRSVGLSPRSERQINDRHLDWSDFVFVMEDGHASRIKNTFRQLDLPPIHVLHIDDVYEYLDEELIELLTDRMNATLKVEMGV